MHLSIFTYFVILLLSSSLSISATRLSARGKAKEPISLDASQNWDGNDGPWSSFTLQAGTPAQNVRVFVSTASSNTWIVRSDGCNVRDNACFEARGRTFNPKSSSTWKELGNYQLDVDQSAGLSVLGTFGNDTLGLGVQGSGGPILESQVFSTYSSDELYFGLLGLNPSSTNFGGADKGGPSIMTNLKEQDLIPSLSFGYTAGNQYRLKQAFGSLTIGGYDSARVIPNQVSINFSNNDDPSKVMQVSIQSILSKTQGGEVNEMLPTAITAHVDSTEPMIMLPTAACQAFEKTFNLTWDKEHRLYLVDDDLHTTLKQQNASLTFIFGNQTTGGATANIVLPYNSFDLILKPPYPGLNQTQRYFPLRRSANDSQNTLGRTFLQEAYLTVDWERRNFSLSQTNFTTAPPKLVPIYSPDSPPPGPSLPSGAKIGIAVAVVVGIVLLTALLTYIFLRHRRTQRDRAARDARTGVNSAEPAIRQGFAKGEMGTGIENERFEMEGNDGNALRPYGGQTPPWVTEKSQNSHSITEVDGRSDRILAELSPATRGRLGLPRSFFGGRGVHEMYDPSSVRPNELQGDNRFRNEMEGSTPSTSAWPSPGTPRSPFSNPSSGRPSPPTPAGLGSRFFGLWRRSGAGSSGPSSPEAPSAPSAPLAPSSTAPGTPADRRRGMSGMVSPATNDGSTPDSRQGTFSERHRGAGGLRERDHSMLSPVSPATDDDERGFWGFGRVR